MSREKLFHNERLKQVRQDHLQLTQQKLAEALGVPVYRIKDIENGKIRMSPEVALLLEEKFNLDFRWLLTGKGTMSRGEDRHTAAREQGIDADSLRQIIESVEKGLLRMGGTLSPDKKAKLMVLLYEHAAETGRPIDAGTVDKYLGLMV